MALRRAWVFLSGPISNGETVTGRAREENIERATLIAESLEEIGFRVYCPHRELRPFAQAGKPYRWLMKECLRALTKVEAICMLPGWKESAGAREEHWFVELLNRSRRGVNTVRKYYSVEDLVRSYE